MALVGVTVAAAASAGAGIAATWPAAPASGVAFAHLGVSQQSISAARAENSLRLTDLAAKSARERAYSQAINARLARQQARRAAAARAAARRAAARAAARRAAARAAAARRAAAQSASAQGTQAAGAPAQPSGSPQQIAAGMLGSFGWPASEFSCLDSLWSHESGWNVTASNPSSGAYGIPQALPGSKMASAGPDWQTDAATQIRWGLGYIKSTYGSPCAAWSHEESTGWY